MIILKDMMPRPEGWGRAMGREVFQRLVKHVERNPDQTVFPISLKGVKRVDYSFSSETIVQLARRFRGEKGFYLTDIASLEIEENIDAAARRVEQPLLIIDGRKHRFIGLLPTPGTKAALDVVVARPQARATEIADAIQVSVANASMKLKQLWSSGFVMRRESVADTGGVEFVYHRIA
jgi:hypothetical protein